MRIERLYLLVGLALALTPGFAAAYNNPSLEWQTLKTEHFEIHYHKGAEWTARQVARVAEEINAPVTELYQYEPDYPVHFIIRDTHDYANGAAYFYENKVEIWATNLEFGFRGTTNWIRNVVTHEYTHIVSIQAATRLPKRIPALYFQLIGFEEEKRPDVLQGYPTHILSIPFAGVMMPPWFAEGVAQYQSPDVQYDCWDAHRDMILRCAILDDKMLTYDEMSFFGKNGHRSEQVYDHGYGLVNYIASEYGPEALVEVTKGLKTIYRLNVDGALKNATGKSGEELYRGWKAHLRKRYESQTAGIRTTERAGKPLATEGYMTIGPAVSPDGKRIAFLSNKGSDYSGTSLYLMDAEGKNAKALAAGASSPPQFSPDGKRIIYSKKGKVDRYGSQVNDLFVYDLEYKKEKRLTRGARIGDPDFSPDGGNIVGVANSDGTHRLVVLDSEGNNSKVILEREEGTQIYNPHYSPDGDRILFGIFEGSTRDIATVSVDGSDFQYVIESPSDERDARWISPGHVIFVSDRTGIFNVYELNVDNGWITQRSNVVGGAFLPVVAPAGGDIVYTDYSAAGYGVFKLDRSPEPVETMDRVAYDRRTAGVFDECQGLRNAGLAGQDGETSLALAHGKPGVRVADATAAQGPAPQPGVREAPTSTKYRPKYTPFHFYPRVVIWDGTPRLGLLMSSFEILDKQALLLGGSYGTDNEFDGFLSYEIRNFFPTLFADLIYIRERAEDVVVDGENFAPPQTFFFDLRYDVWQADLGLKLEFSEANSLTSQHELALFWAHPEYAVSFDGRQFDEKGVLVTPFDAGWKYYTGNQAHLRYSFRALSRAVDTDINPRGGRAITLSYARAWDQLFEGGEFEYGFRPRFTDNNYNQYTVDWREYVGLPWLRHSLRLRLYGSVIDSDVNDFFWFYVGGRDGIRGYTYYTIGGRKGAMGSVAYRFPIWRNINQQLLSLYFRDLYGGVFFEAANAWNGVRTQENEFKKAVGYELRLALGSYYVFPTAVSFVSAYAFDPVTFELPGFLTTITQEKGWSYYFTVGFGFDL